MIEQFVIIGIPLDNGIPNYYTGICGNNWLSPHKSDAYKYNSLENAKQKSDFLNRYSSLHGYGFDVIHA